MAQELKINIRTTALVVIDLQKGIISIPTEPYASDSVIEKAAALLNAARSKSMSVFLVNVARSPDMKDTLHPISESSFKSPGYDPEWSRLVPEMNVQPSDFLITKHQWGAFYGTGLDLQLRRRKIDTIILCGISTNIGVESTARFAYEYGYNQVFASDAMAARSVDEHEYPLKYIFPRIGLIRNSSEIIKAMC